MSAAAAAAATTSSTTRSAVTTAASKPISVRKVAASKTQNKPGIGVELLTAGSAACVADLFTFPLDTAKVRLQVSQSGECTRWSNRIWKLEKDLEIDDLLIDLSIYNMKCDRHTSGVKSSLTTQ